MAGRGTLQVRMQVVALGDLRVLLSQVSKGATQRDFRERAIT